MRTREGVPALTTRGDLCQKRSKEQEVLMLATQALVYPFCAETLRAEIMQNG